MSNTYNEFARILKLYQFSILTDIFYTELPNDLKRLFNTFIFKTYNDFDANLLKNNNLQIISNTDNIENANKIVIHFNGINPSNDKQIHSIIHPKSGIKITQKIFIEKRLFTLTVYDNSNSYKEFITDQAINKVDKEKIKTFNPHHVPSKDYKNFCLNLTLRYLMFFNLNIDEDFYNYLFVDIEEMRKYRSIIIEYKIKNKTNLKINVLGYNFDNLNV